jgi:hypothetical protein
MSRWVRYKGLQDSPLHKVDARGSFHDVANLTWAQRKRGFLEFRLHFATAEESSDMKLVWRPCTA